MTIVRRPVRAGSSRESDVDYDVAAEVYDRRYAEGEPDGIATSLHETARRIGARTALEVGCGTGHWLGRLNLSAVYGVDLSPDMLRKARGKGLVPRLICADAHRLPFSRGCFDLVYCVNALHHFRQPPSFLAEAQRVLNHGGAVAVVGMSPATKRDDWYLYDFFPGTRETDGERYPSVDRIEAWMRDTGCTRVRHGIAARIAGSRVGREILDDPILHRNGTSQLALLSDEEFAGGLERLRSAIDEDPHRVFSMDVSLYMTVGQA